MSPGGLTPYPAASAEPPTRPRRRSTGKGWLIALGVLLAIAIAAIALLTAFLLQTRSALEQTTGELDRTIEELEDRQRRLDEQREQLDEKETFGQSMGALMDTVARFDGVPAASLVDFGRIELLAGYAWKDRHDVAAVRRYTAEIDVLTADFAAVLAEADARVGTNASGTLAETLIDELGRGFVETVWGDAGAVCQTEALGCVWGGEPLIIHLDVDGFAQPYRTEWGETLVAYHEFAHVLQFTNPLPTVDALGAFGGDNETMADCYALTMLDAWSLEERVWASGASYWDVTYGYGQVCDDAQRDVIRDWVASLGVQVRPVSQ